MIKYIELAEQPTLIKDMKHTEQGTILRMWYHPAVSINVKVGDWFDHEGEFYVVRRLLDVVLLHNAWHLEVDADQVGSPDFYS